tara:strand:- start:476 stop:676 length:201 start_codon:yes stop_codon:yes gene_type:complete
MTQDEIIEMAREVYGTAATEQEIRFAKLIAAAEREACAKVCDELFADVLPYSAPDCPAAIRARGQA